MGVAARKSNSELLLEWNRNLLYTDSGEYICTSQNNVGTNAVKINLLVQCNLYDTGLNTVFTNDYILQILQLWLLYLELYQYKLLLHLHFLFPADTLEMFSLAQDLVGLLLT